MVILDVDKVKSSKVQVTKVVFPNTTNHHHTLFGGTAMKWMDETAFIAATRFCRKKVVTISSGRIDFKEPIPADSIVDIQAQVSSVGNTSLEVLVEIFQEDMYTVNTRKKSISGTFTFVALDCNNKPTSIL